LLVSRSISRCSWRQLSSTIQCRRILLHVWDALASDPLRWIMMNVAAKGWLLLADGDGQGLDDANLVAVADIRVVCR